MGVGGDDGTREAGLRLDRRDDALRGGDSGEAAIVPGDAAANFAALAELKKAHPHLRTLISIGGWGAGGFSDAALTEASRKRLVNSCMALFFDHHAGSFDGVDIDWEFPVSGGPKELAHRPQDRANLMVYLNQQGSNLPLPAAPAAGAATDLVEFLLLAP